MLLNDSEVIAERRERKGSITTKELRDSYTDPEKRNYCSQTLGYAR
jgi:hypothetical protein